MSWARRIEITANVGVVLVLAGLAYQWLALRYTTRSANQAVVSVGAKLPDIGVDWRASKRTLVFVLSTSCRYCTESAQFYATIGRSSRTTRTVAVFPQPENEAVEYTQRLGLTFDTIRPGIQTKNLVPGTPTLLLVNADGVVEDLWVGLLPEDSQKEILAKL